MTPTSRHQQVEKTLTDLDQACTRVRIAPVTTHTGIARATLYLHPEAPKQLIAAYTTWLRPGTQQAGRCLVACSERARRGR